MAVCNDQKCQTLNVKSRTLFVRLALSCAPESRSGRDVCLLFFHIGAKKIYESPRKAMSTSAGFLTEPTTVRSCIEQRMYSYGLSAYGVTKLICYLRGETNYRNLQKAVTDALHAIERSKLPMVFDIVTALGGEFAIACPDNPELYVKSPEQLRQIVQDKAAGMKVSQIASAIATRRGLTSGYQGIHSSISKSLRSLDNSQFLRVSEIIEVLGFKLFIRWQTLKLSGSSKGQLLGTLIPLVAPGLNLIEEQGNHLLLPLPLVSEFQAHFGLHVVTELWKITSTAIKEE